MLRSRRAGAGRVGVLVAVLAAAVAAVLVAGCGGAGTVGAIGAGPTDGAASVPAEADPSADAASPQEPAVESAAPPAPETSGPEAPEPTVQKPAVLTAGAPNGGGVDDPSLVQQCLTITYISQIPIPDPTRLTITRTWLTGPELFTIGGAGCANSDLPGCLKHVWTAASIAAGEGRCAIPLVAVAAGQAGEQQLVHVEVEIWCGSLATADCAAFGSAIDGDDQHAQLTLDPAVLASPTSS